MNRGMKRKPELRGGSWNNNDNNCRVANRNNNNPDNRNNNNGLRVANAIFQFSAGTGKTIFYRACDPDSPVSDPDAQAPNDYLQVSSSFSGSAACRCCGD